MAWIQDITVRSYDDVKTQIIEHLTVDWEFEDLEVVWHSDPIDHGDHYLVHDAEILFSWGFTDDFRALHGTGR